MYLRTRCVIPAIQEPEIGKIMFEVDPGKKMLVRPPSQQKIPGVVGYAYISAMREAKSKKISA
jgi:hypothetical protein